MRSLSATLDSVIHYAPAVRTATPTAATVDLQAHDGVTFLVYTGAGGITFTGTNRLDWVAQHSNDGTTFTDCATGDIVNANGVNVTISSGRIESYTSAKADESLTQYSYVGNRRYVRVTPTFGGTHGTGTNTACIAVRTFPNRALA